jgi:hypothetical protein
MFFGSANLEKQENFCWNENYVDTDLQFTIRKEPFARLKGSKNIFRRLIFYEAILSTVSKAFF